MNNTDKAVAHDQTEEMIDDPEIAAWLNEGQADEDEVRKEELIKAMKEKEEEGSEKEEEEEEEEEGSEEEENVEVPAGESAKTVIENMSEVPYQENRNACEIDDGYIARILMNALKGKKGGVDDYLMEEGEEDAMDDGQKKKKKLNKNSRAYKQEKKERAAAAQKEKEEKAEKIREEMKRLEELKPVPKYMHARPVKKTATGLQALAKKKQCKK